MMRHVVSLSGGKDSVATCLYLREQGIEHDRVFMDTGWEHRDLYAHLDYLESKLGPIHRVVPSMPELDDRWMDRVQSIEALVGRSPSAYVRWAVRKGMFASRMRRYCTQELKVRPFLAWVDALDEEIINVVGIRADESAARAKLGEREAMPGAEHIEVWRPLLRWTEADVIDIHRRHAIEPCPLYLRGSTRVGCWPCIQANKGELAQLAKDYERVEAIRQLESLVADVAAARNAARGPRAMFQAPLPVKTDDGATWPCWPIDRVLEWSQTTRGGRQMRLGDWGEEEGCVRWGMCEVAKA